MVFDAVSVHRDKVLSMETFLKAINPREKNSFQGIPSEQEGNSFSSFERLPTFDEAAELLVDEAMKRSNGNQTFAARLLGISQPALSKRLKMRKM
jgi:transcriptional regulator with PAS, ATPase and Fis domain